MNTKLKGDIAEQATIMRLLQFGWGVSKQVGDRLPYDLIADVSGTLVRLQVKCAWFNTKDQCFVVDVRRTKTNRRIMLREPYTNQDFDFAVVYAPDINVFYVFPVEAFIAYGSTLTLVESDKRQRKPKSSVYREAFR